MSNNYVNKTHKYKKEHENKACTDWLNDHV